MKTLNLSGFKPSDSLDISVAQGAITAGPINVPAWGAANTGGTITLNVSRTVMHCAPDSVRFSVDLSASTFDTPAPVGDEVYDYRLHDLIYLWDFDDASSGSWSAPVNVLSGWKNRNTAKGPWVAHMYQTPGTYNPSILVIEPSSGKTATASVSLTVVDPDTVYAGTDTICVNPVNDDDFAGKPPGAAEINLDELLTTSPEWIARQGGNPKRWLFKRNNTFVVGLRIAASDTPGISFGAYGSGSRPIIRVKIGQNASNTIISVNNQHTGSDGSLAHDMRFSRLAFEDDYDPVTQSQSVSKVGLAGPAIWSLAVSDMMVHDCTFTGFASSSVLFDPSMQTLRTNFHMDDCVITKFGGQYPFMSGVSTHADGSNTFTGTRISQIPGAVDDFGIRAPIRINFYQNTHMRGCDIYHTDHTQPCVKLNESPRADGALINVHSCSLESGLWPISFNLNGKFSIGRTVVQNAIIDGLIIVGFYGTQFLVRTKGTGITLRNSLLIQPASPNYVTSDRLVGIVGVDKQDGVLADNVTNAPVRVYNCTVRMDRSNAQNGSNANTPPLIKDSTEGAYTAISETNNVVHMPNLDVPVTDFAPLSEDTLWTPRCVGYRSPTSYVLETQYATPLDAVKDTRPLTTPIESPAIGFALTGNVSYQDILQRKRPEPPSKGAWEVAE